MKQLLASPTPHLQLQLTTQTTPNYPLNPPLDLILTIPSL